MYVEVRGGEVEVTVADRCRGETLFRDETELTRANFFWKSAKGMTD
jgi:hypothetical protein